MLKKITKVFGREILDSRGNPTVEVDVYIEGGLMGRAAVPSGASTGIHEAVELRDSDKKRYNGKGVLKAVENVNTEIADAVVGMIVTDQEGVDKKMIEIDGTLNKARLGANAILGVSLAVARVAAMSEEKLLYRYLNIGRGSKLPCPMFNILNGGVHANWQGSDFQEFMVCPVGAPSFREALRMGSEIYHTLKTILKEKECFVGIGDEGGFAPNLKSNAEALDVILESIIRAGYEPRKDIMIALDPASSEFYENGIYKLRSEGRELSSAEMVDLYAEWVDKYPIIVIEDGLAQDDWDGWKLLTEKIGDKVELVGDDLFVTNVDRLKMGIEKGVANGVLIKFNQIGTLTETIATIEKAYEEGYGAMMSHRSGETVDSFIAELAMATNCGHIKTGAPCRGERIEKYNQFLRIEEEMGNDAVYAGRSGFVR
jgi:enolase